jgi:hypothetical protein
VLRHSAPWPPPRPGRTPYEADRQAAVALPGALLVLLTFITRHGYDADKEGVVPWRAERRKEARQVNHISTARFLD